MLYRLLDVAYLKTLFHCMLVGVVLTVLDVITVVDKVLTRLFSASVIRDWREKHET